MYPVYCNQNSERVTVCWYTNPKEARQVANDLAKRFPKLEFEVGDLDLHPLVNPTFQEVLEVMGE